MTQDFWAGSGFHRLERDASGYLVATDAWIAGFLEREELLPPEEAGPRERRLHARLSERPRLRIEPADLASVEDPDARENWEHFLRFRDRVLSHPTLEACYANLFAAGVDIAPVFIDALAEAITRSILDGTEDAWLCRAGELLFRQQRVSTEGGQILAADAATIEAFEQTGGFGNLGRLMRQQKVELPTPKMDVLSRENAALYFLRDALRSFLLDLTPGREGAAALATVMEKWVAHFAGVRVSIEPVERVEDDRWRWHVGLDVDSTAILNALYRGEAVGPEQRERLAVLFRLAFHDSVDVLPEVAGRPVYLGLAFRPDHTLKMKPQNLLANLPLARAG